MYHYKLQEHAQSCPEQFIQCPYRPFGCLSKVRRKLLQQHLQKGSTSQDHLSPLHERYQNLNPTLLNLYLATSKHDAEAIPLPHPFAEPIKKRMLVDVYNLEHKAWKTATV
jgi:hypothetical protein